MNHPKKIGIISEAQAQLDLLKLGFTVSKPVGDNAAYDLIVDCDNKLFKIQVKTAYRRFSEPNKLILKMQKVRINTKHTYTTSYSEQEVDYFIVVDQELLKSYCIKNTQNVQGMVLYVSDMPTNLGKRGHRAEDYLLNKDSLK